MQHAVSKTAAFILTHTRLELWRVRVRAGVARGARWTLFPWTSYWRGMYEPALQSALMTLGNGDIRGWNCWDLGAHFGLYSVGLALRVGPSGQVAAFEPNPTSFARLALHRRLNHLDWLVVYRAAASDHSDGAELLTYGDLRATTTHLRYEGECRTAETVPIPVRTVRLDDLVETRELRMPNVVKIDVEGHGHHALAGMKRTLRSACPIIIMGFHSPQELAGTMEILASLGYSWRDVAGGTNRANLEVGGDYIFTPAR